MKMVTRHDINAERTGNNKDNQTRKSKDNQRREKEYLLIPRDHFAYRAVMSMIGPEKQHTTVIKQYTF